MKNRAIEKISTNITILGNIRIKDNHNENWILSQLIVKYQILLKHLNTELDVDMKRFCNIINEVQEECNYFIFKYT